MIKPVPSFTVAEESFTTPANYAGKYRFWTGIKAESFIGNSDLLEVLSGHSPSLRVI
jgi:hypothetical protein